MRFTIIILILSTTVFANIPKGLEIEPIYGFEKFYRKDRLLGVLRTITTVGARARYKIPLVAVEAEYTKGTDTDNVLSNNKVETLREALRLGIVATFREARTVNINFKFGLWAKRDTIKTTLDGDFTEVVGNLILIPL
jgi:hypothetical protein